MTPTTNADHADDGMRLFQAQQELAAGRELDALVAEKVMGWHQAFDGLNQRWANAEGQHHRYVNRAEVGGNPEMFWCPSLDIAAAWEVVEKLKADWRFLFQETPSRKWRAAFTHHRYTSPHGMADANTAPMAICLAALKAVSA